MEQRSLPRRFLSGLNSPLRVRTHLLIAACAAVAMLAIWVEGVGAEDAAHNLASTAYQARVSAAATGVSARLTMVSATLDESDDLIAHDHDLASLCNIMGRGQQRPYQRLYAFNTAGEVKCSTVPGTHDQPEVTLQHAYFQGALATGRDQVGGPLVEVFSGRPSVVIAHPVRNGGSTAGVLVAAIDVSALFDSKVAVRSDRNLLFGRDGGWFETGSLAPTSPPFGVSGTASRSLTTGEPCPVSLEGQAAWTCSPVGESGLVIVTAHSGASVFATVSDTVARRRYRMLGVVAIALVAAFASDFLFLRRVRLAYGNAGLAGLGAGDTVKRDEIDALGAWAETAGESLHRLREEVDGHERRQRNSEHDLLTSIAETVEIRYPFLRNHGDRVGRYVRQIGTRLGFSDHDLDLLEFAARVHDLGKIAIADAVYLKPGRLDPIEAAQMQLHAARGGEIASRMRNIPPEVAEAIRHHHERWDGTGYPDGLAGTDIPLWSRVIAVADSYDAMTEERPYRERPRTHDESLQILREGAGVQWDTTAVHAFLEVVESGNVLPKPIPLSSRRAASDG